MRLLGLGGRIRISTAILALVFLLTLVIYLLVRPVPKTVTGTTGPAAPSPTGTSSKRSDPSVYNRPSPTGAPSPSPSPSATGIRPSKTPSPSQTASDVVSPSPG